MKQLIERLGYDFKEPALLEEALTHSSFANEGNRHVANNERLEFLGDSVLGMIAASYLFEHDKSREGELTKLRASIVCEQALSSYSRELGVGEHLRLGKGERMNGGQDRPSILADAFEAILAAIFLDGGMEAAKAFVTPFLVKEIASQKRRHFKDYKTQLQEIVQQTPEERVEYVLTGESGPDHNKRFTVEVHLNSNVIGRGEGKSKKNAEQQAAKEALGLMGITL